MSEDFQLSSAGIYLTAGPMGSEHPEYQYGDIVARLYEMVTDPDWHHPYVPASTTPLQTGTASACTWPGWSDVPLDYVLAPGHYYEVILTFSSDFYSTFYWAQYPYDCGPITVDYGTMPTGNIAHFRLNGDAVPASGIPDTGPTLALLSLALLGLGALRRSTS